MSNTQNLAYAVVQLAHNFGAVAAVGGSLAALKFCDIQTRKWLAWIVLAGLLTQAVSGAAFGVVSYYFYHHLPDIAGLAIIALMIKVFCVAAGILLLVVFLVRSNSGAVVKMNVIWMISAALTVVAISAAAFLRWFS
jgi:hypothetical protein